MNANITATGAMIALGLTYFNTKNKYVCLIKKNYLNILSTSFLSIEILQNGLHLMISCD